MLHRVRCRGLHRSCSYLDMPKEIVGEYAEKIGVEIREGFLLGVEDLLQEISQLPPLWQKKFIERGSIYPELFPLVGKLPDGKVLTYVEVTKEHNLSTVALLCLSLVIKVIKIWRHAEERSQEGAAPSR